jgi:hypothetical protein
MLTPASVHNENREVLTESKSDLGNDVVEWTVEEETALRHKIDRRIVPLVTILYLLCVSSPTGTPAKGEV